MINQQQMGYGAPPPPEMMMAASNKVAGWNNFDSGIQTRVASNAPSVMSGASSMHGELHRQVHEVAGFERLPVMEEQMNAHLEATRSDRVRAAMFPELGDGAQSHMAPFECARPANVQALAEPSQVLKASLVNLVNYQDNADLAVRAIPELIKLLADPDEVVVTKAALMVDQLAKQDHNSSVVASHEPLVQALVRALAATRNEDMERHATGALYSISSQQPGRLVIFRTGGIGALVSMLKSPVTSIVYYAITTLHNLLYCTAVGAVSKVAVRQAGAVDVMVGLIDKSCPDGRPDDKFLAILVDCIHLLADNQATKAEIARLGCPAKIVEIFRTNEYEKLLYMSARLLKRLSVCPQNKPALVQAGAAGEALSGGVQALQRHLSHMSQRLLRDVLLVLRNLSDAATQEDNMDGLLLSVVQLLGSSDVDIVTYCVGVLANLSCNNERNKQTLCLNYGMESLVRTIEAHKNNVDVCEPALLALRHLTARHTLAEEAQKHFGGMANGSGLLIVVGQLATMKPTVVKAALGLLANLVNQTENLLSLREARVMLDEAARRTGNHVDIAVDVLTHAWFSIREAQSRGLATVPTIDGVSMFELVESATLALHKFAADPHARARILSSAQPLVPVFVHLLSFEHNNVQRAAAGVLKELVEDGNGLLQIEREDPSAILTELLHSPNRCTASYATDLLQKLSVSKAAALEAFGVGSASTFHDELAAWQQDGIGEMPSEPFAELMYQQAQAYDDPAAHMNQLQLGSPAGGILWNGADSMDLYGAPLPQQHVTQAPPLPPHTQQLSAPSWHDTTL